MVPQVSCRLQALHGHGHKSLCSEVHVVITSFREKLKTAKHLHYTHWTKRRSFCNYHWNPNINCHNRGHPGTNNSIKAGKDAKQILKLDCSTGSIKTSPTHRFLLTWPSDGRYVTRHCGEQSPYLFPYLRVLRTELSIHCTQGHFGNSWQHFLGSPTPWLTFLKNQGHECTALLQNQDHIKAIQLSGFKWKCSNVCSAKSLKVNRCLDIKVRIRCSWFDSMGK